MKRKTQQQTAPVPDITGPFLRVLSMSLVLFVSGLFLGRDDKRRRQAQGSGTRRRRSDCQFDRDLVGGE